MGWEWGELKLLYWYFLYSIKNGPSMDARIPTLQFVRQRWESRGRPSYTKIFVNALTRSKVAGWRFYSGKHWQRSSTDSMEKKFSREHKQKQSILKWYATINLLLLIVYILLNFSTSLYKFETQNKGKLMNLINNMC